MTRRWMRSGAALLAGALVLTACGGDDETSDPDPTTTDAGETSAPDDDGTGTPVASGGDCGTELKLGVLVPLTGELGDFGGIWQEAFELAVEQVNESSLLPEDWEMTVTVGDEQTDPEEGLRAARNMIESQNVSAIVGPTSGPIVAMVDLAADTQTPIISEAAGTINLNELGGEWVYRTVTSDLGDGEALAEWFLSTDVGGLGMLVQNEESTVSPAAVLKEQFTSGGGEVVAEVNYNPGQSSYQAELQRVLDADPGTLLLAGGQESGITIIREARQLGYEGDIMVTADMVVPEVIEALGPDVAEGLYGESAATDASLETYQRFAADYEEAYGEEPGLFTANAYDAAALVALAATAAGSTCGADINAQLREVAGPPGVEVSAFDEAAEALANGEDIDYFGVSGPVDFDESGTVAGAYSIYQVQDSSWEEIEFLPAETFN